MSTRWPWKDAIIARQASPHSAASDCRTRGKYLRPVKLSMSAHMRTDSSGLISQLMSVRRSNMMSAFRSMSGWSTTFFP
jgi:hypothetical protein